MKYILLFALCFALRLPAQVTINMQLKSSLPSFPRGDFGAFLIDSNYYVVGGIDSISTQTSEVWRYTITTDHWQRMHDFSGGPIGEHQCFAIGQKGYIVTGIDSVSGYSDDNEFWEYNVQADTWIQKANFSGGKREGATSFSYNGKGYFAFGIWHNVAYENDVWEYDPSVNIWTLRTDTLPGLGRYGCVNTTVYGSAYFLGGYPALSNNTRLNELWHYDILNGTWDSLTPIPGIGRELSLLYGFKDFLLAGFGANQTGLLHDCYTYNYATKHWAVAIINNFVQVTADNQSACFVYKNIAYLFGGVRNSNLKFYNNVWSFDATPYALLTGLDEISVTEKLNVYPNPVTAQHPLVIQSQAAGSISFYSDLGQLLYTTDLHTGDNQVGYEELRVNSGVVFYTVTLGNGSVQNGRVVVY